MAHPCFDCGGECYCNGDLSDSVDSLTPGKCIGCEDCQDDPHYQWEPDEDEDNTLDSEYQEAVFNCGQMPGGGCSLVGTEHCDWNCPFSHEL